MKEGWTCPNCGNAHSLIVETCPEPPKGWRADAPVDTLGAVRPSVSSVCFDLDAGDCGGGRLSAEGIFGAHHQARLSHADARGLAMRLMHPRKED